MKESLYYLNDRSNTMTSPYRSCLLILTLATILAVGFGGEASLGVASRSDVDLGTATCNEGSCEAPEVTVEDDSCVDNHLKCSEWSEKGECEKNPKYMLNFCQQSCGVCVNAGNSTTE